MTQPLKILLIGAGNTSRQGLHALLKDAGHEVFLAEEGYEGLSRIQQTPVDVVFCNDVLDKLSGYEICWILRQVPQTAQVPIVILSQNDTLLERTRWREAGAQGIIPRPHDKSTVLSVLQQVVSSTGRQLID